MRGVLRALYRGALSAQLRLRGGPTHYVCSFWGTCVPARRSSLTSS